MTSLDKFSIPLHYYEEGGVVFINLYYYNIRKEWKMITRIRRFIIRKLTSKMPVALNIKVREYGVDMGSKASLSENITFSNKE